MKESSKPDRINLARKPAARRLAFFLTGLMTMAVVFGLSGCASGRQPDDQSVLAAYQREMLLAIDKEKRYPYGAMDARKQGKVTISFDYTADGRADNMEIEKSSGDPNLDHAALMAVYFAKLPPEPRELKGITRFIVDVNFELD